jgi:hypothetical protein
MPQTHAALEVTIDGVEHAVDGSVVASTGDARALVQVTDGTQTVFVSLRTPLEPGALAIDSANTGAVYVWAKESPHAPMIATTGGVDVSAASADWTLRFQDVAKPADAFGPSLTIRGEVVGVHFE